MFVSHVRRQLLFLSEAVAALLAVEPVLVVVDHLVPLQAVDADERLAALGADVRSLLHMDTLSVQRGGGGGVNVMSLKQC